MIQQCNGDVVVVVADMLALTPLVFESFAAGDTNNTVGCTILATYGDAQYFCLDTSLIQHCIQLVFACNLPRLQTAAADVAPSLFISVPGVSWLVGYLRGHLATPDREHLYEADSGRGLGVAKKKKRKKKEEEREREQSRERERESGC
jgi:hypothetical protein